MGQLRRFREASFANDLLNARSPVLVCFTSVWSGPCRLLLPIVEQLADQWGSRVTVGTLDISTDIHTTTRYKVLQAPTLILFVNGAPVVRTSGLLSRERLIACLAPHIVPRPIAPSG